MPRTVYNKRYTKSGGMFVKKSDLDKKRIEEKDVSSNISENENE